MLGCYLLQVSCVCGGCCLFISFGLTTTISQQSIDGYHSCHAQANASLRLTFTCIFRHSMTTKVCVCRGANQTVTEGSIHLSLEPSSSHTGFRYGDGWFNLWAMGNEISDNKSFSLLPSTYHGGKSMTVRTLWFYLDYKLFLQSFGMCLGSLSRFSMTSSQTMARIKGSKGAVMEL